MFKEKNMAISENAKKYKMEYDREYTKLFSLKLYRTKDQDIIDRLESMPSKQSYIKELIRADIRREKEAQEK